MPLRDVKLAELVEDWDIYPRHNYDSAWVRHLADVLESGGELPAPVIARKGMRIVDGWHRVKAYRRHLGAGGVIKADVRAYKDEADVVRDAVKLNAAHGRKLDAQDKARSAILLEQHGVVVDEIQVILHMPAQKIREITASPGRIIIIRDEKTPAKPAARSPGSAAPRVLTPDQERAHRSASGLYETQIARDLIRRIRSGLFIPAERPAAVAVLWELHDVIEAKLERPAPEEEAAAS